MEIICEWVLATFGVLLGLVGFAALCAVVGFGILASVVVLLAIGDKLGKAEKEKSGD